MDSKESWANLGLEILHVRERIIPVASGSEGAIPFR